MTDKSTYQRKDFILDVPCFEAFYIIQINSFSDISFYTVALLLSKYLHDLVIPLFVKTIDLHTVRL